MPNILFTFALVEINKLWKLQEDCQYSIRALKIKWTSFGMNRI